MLERERQRTSEAQQQLADERKRYDERIEALINEQREERRRANEERRIANEERRLADAERRLADERAAAAQQAMLATIAELTGAIAELRRQNNGGNGTANGQS